MTRCFVFWLFAPVLLAQSESMPVFGTTVVIPGGLKGDVYHLPSNTNSLTILDRLKPSGAIYTNSLAVPPQDFSMGFPGLTNRFEWFAIDYSGRFWIERPGLYRFRLVSDDGAVLYVDGQMIIDNDGLHSPVARIGSIRLGGGMHSIRVPYFQGPRTTVALLLEVAGPGEQPRVFSTEEFKPPVDPLTWRFSGELPNEATDADLPRVHPERIPGPENGAKPKAVKRRR